MRDALGRMATYGYIYLLPLLALAVDHLPITHLLPPSPPTSHHSTISPSRVTWSVLFSSIS